MGSDADKAPHSKHHTSHSHTIQSPDFSTCAESKHISMSNSDHNFFSQNMNIEFNDYQQEKMMKDYRKYNQDKMTAHEIREPKCKTFPYLSNDDVRLSMSDRNIIRKGLDLDTDLVLSGTEKQSIRDLFYSMHECLSTHDNPSVQNKSYVSLNPVNLKPFYIKPFLTHKSEIMFAEAEMEKLRQMGILHKGSSEFLSPIMLIKKSHNGAKLNKTPEYRLEVDFKYLHSHLPDIKFSYPEIKHVLHKIGRHSSHVYSVLNLKHIFHSINLTENSKKCTSCCASPGSPTYQFNKAKA